MIWQIKRMLKNHDLIWWEHSAGKGPVEIPFWHPALESYLELCAFFNSSVSNRRDCGDDDEDDTQAGSL